MSFKQGAWRSGLLESGDLPGLVVIHQGLAFLQNPDGSVFWQAEDALALCGAALLDVQGVGHWQDTAVAVFELGVQVEGRGHWIPLRHFLQTDDVGLYHLLAFASQVGTWSRQHRFCGSCGAAMESSAEHRMRTCEPCGLDYYPRLSPSMIVLVTRGDEVLLGRAPRFAEGMYSCLAGYAEPAESMEGCVHREVYEETSIRVDNLRYITSQNWPFPHSLMFGYHADYLSGEIKIQEDELDDARWFNIRELPQLPMQGSIARYLIDLYVHQRLGGAEPVLPR